MERVQVLVLTIQLLYLLSGFFPELATAKLYHV